MKKNNFKTLANLIAELNALAKKYGDNIPVFVYDEYLANEGWDYETIDLYQAPRAQYVDADEEDIKEGVPKNYIQID